MIVLQDDLASQENNRNGLSPKKSKESDGSKDGAAYTCLLKNELLGTEIDDVKAQTDNKKQTGPTETNNLFRVSVLIARHS